MPMQGCTTSTCGAEKRLRITQAALDEAAIHEHSK